MGRKKCKQNKEVSLLAGHSAFAWEKKELVIGRCISPVNISYNVKKYSEGISFEGLY